MSYLKRLTSEINVSRFYLDGNPKHTKPPIFYVIMVKTLEQAGVIKHTAKTSLSGNISALLPPRILPLYI